MTVIPAPQPARRGTDNRWQTAMTLGARLIRAAGMPAVCELAAATAARSIGAVFASVAVVEEGRRLAIQGTFGYPIALVRHVPLELENTVIGRVLQTRRGVLSIGSNAAASPSVWRARYRTGSFIALPIRSRGEVMGVLSVADPIGRDAFIKADVSRVERCCRSYPWRSDGRGMPSAPKPTRGRRPSIR